jgi:hypothetical protein
LQRPSGQEKETSRKINMDRHTRTCSGNPAKAEKITVEKIAKQTGTSKHGAGDGLVAGAASKIRLLPNSAAPHALVLAFEMVGNFWKIIRVRLNSRVGSENRLTRKI